MKKMILALIAVAQLTSMQARADVFDIIGDIIGGGHGRPSRPNYPPGPYNPVRCTYVDEGWEEHSFAHNSCGECLSFHGNCVETCSTQEVSCQAVGTDYRGQQQSVYVYAEDQWMAERRAYETCRYQNLSNCHIENCDVQEHTVSERLCR